MFHKSVFQLNVLKTALVKISQTGLSTMDKITKIGTHDGTFHCDEVLGCYMLRLLSPGASVVRSRKPEVLDTCDIVIDVGGTYDPEKRRFDHHQKEFDLTASPFLPKMPGGKEWNIKLSSAGLVYCHFGREIIKKVIGSDVEPATIDALFLRVYEGFIQEIDAIDNGVPISDGEQKYYISTHLSARVKHLNPSWNETNVDVEQAFNKAMAMVGEEFKSKIIRLYKQWWPARSIVMDAVEKRYDVDPSGEIVELGQFCPWATHLFEIEKEMDIKTPIKYVIFPASQERTVYRVQGVPEEDASFVLRKPLHEKWRGLRDEELSKISGIDGCIFVHATGFIGGNNTRDGALEMAKRSLMDG